MDQGSERSDTIKVALIDDKRLVRNAIVSVLNESPDIEAVAAASNGHEVLLEAGVHVVLLNLGRTSGDILRVARDILKDHPDAGVIVMDLLPAHEDLNQFISAGVSGFIMKDAPLDAVLTTIRSIASGRKVLPDEMTAALFSEIAGGTGTSGGTQNQDLVRLTPREREVSALVAESLSNRAIGERLQISVHTVKSHLRNIMDKLDANSRLQVATYVHQRDAQAADLRRRAEARVEREPEKAPAEPDKLARDEVERTLHELQVHQIELEMQNEELRRSRAELEASRERYFDLFDLAPVGYFTQTEDGQTLDANLTAARFLDVSRSDLLDRPFTRFIHPEDQDVFYHHRRVVLRDGSGATCRLRLVRADGSSFHALLESTPSRPVDGHPTFRTVVSDVSDQEEGPGTHRDPPPTDG
jgi:PAS domain S-box-containing protein